MITDEMDLDLDQDCPDFNQIKNSPSTSPVASPRSVKENSVILEARDLSSVAIGELGGTPVYVMPVSCENSPYRSPPQLGVSRPVPPLLSPPDVSGLCNIQIVEEPEEKFRFRYKSEMQGTHGCIHGKNHQKKKAKKFPTVGVQNVPSDVETVRLRVALYTNERPRKHHVHKIMSKQFSEQEQDFIEVDISRKNGFQHVWQGLGIIHTSRRHIDETLFNRIKKVYLEQKGKNNNDNQPYLTDSEEVQLKSDAANMGKEVTDKLNTVVLGFEAFRVEAGIYIPLCAMAFTNPINNLKNPSTGELKICRISAFSGSVSGGDEIFIFIERVKKGDIQVKFFQLDDNEERVWEEFAEFTEGDVHHQYAIAFKTPAYKDQTVSEDVNVFFELYRPSDTAFSEPKAFRYKPREEVRLGKRARIATRSQPLPNRPVQDDSENQRIPNGETSFKLENIIDNLLQNEDYMDSLNEPSPYDHMIPTTDVVPDLLVFSKPLLDLSNTPIITVGHSICTDSGTGAPSPATTGGDQTRELNTEVLRRMTEAMSNLTTICTSERARDSVRDSLSNMMANEEGDNIVHMAVNTSSASGLKLITEMFRKIGTLDILDDQNKARKTPLHLSTQLGQRECVRILLDCQASPDRLDLEGETPVHIAVRNNDLETLRILLSFKADPNIPNNFGKFPLHLAVENNLLEVVQLLVTSGVDVEARDQISGKTVLHLAVERQLEEMVNFLVRDAKVDLAREDFNGMTAVQAAEKYNSQNIKKIFNKEMKKQPQNGL